MPIPYILQDSFFRGNADVNAGFQAYVETPALSWAVNGLQASSATNPAFLAVQAQVPADCRVAAYEGTTTGVWGVFARGGGTYNGGSDTYYRADLNGTTLTLRKSVAGTLTTISSVTVARAVGAALMLDCVGGTIQVWYNGVLAISQADASIPGTTATLSTGLWNGSTTATAISLLNVQGDTVWAYTPNEFKQTDEWHNSVVEYRSGFVQRNAYWRRARASGELSQKIVRYPDKAVIRNFFNYLQGMLTSFLIQPPEWKTAFSGGPLLPTLENYAKANGADLTYKVNVDKAATITTYTDGVLDSPQPAVSLLTGIVQYVSPPYAGAQLSYSATGPYYRVYFSEDKATHEYKVPNYFWITLGVRQDKVVELGAAA